MTCENDVNNLDTDKTKNFGHAPVRNICAYLTGEWQKGVIDAQAHKGWKWWHKCVHVNGHSAS